MTYIYLPNLGTILYSRRSLVISSRWEWGGLKHPFFCHSQPHYHQLLPCLCETCWLEHKRGQTNNARITPKSSHHTCEHRATQFVPPTETLQQKEGKWGVMAMSTLTESSAWTPKHTNACRDFQGLSNHQCHSQCDTVILTQAAINENI